VGETAKTVLVALVTTGQTTVVVVVDVVLVDLVVPVALAAQVTVALLQQKLLPPRKPKSPS
jgi:hypothetical protein